MVALFVRRADVLTDGSVQMLEDSGALESRLPLLGAELIYELWPRETGNFLFLHHSKEQSLELVISHHFACVT